MEPDRTFNWAPNFDPESKEFPIRTAVPNQIRRNKLWRTGPILDQGREGACVGFGWTAEALSTPVAVDLSRLKADAPEDPTAFAHRIYKRAQQLDGWAGENYSGTSVLAGAKAMREMGLIKEFRWAFNIADVIDGIIHKGPVVLGIPWHMGMYDAPDGVLRLSGENVGGHCITAVGYKVSSEKLNGEDGIILQNSWGTDWGINGLAIIRTSELAGLLDNYGEACVPSRRSYGR
jgi:Papain family cysteine protease